MEVVTPSARKRPSTPPNRPRPTPAQDDARYVSRTISKALATLELLQAETAGRTMNSIAQQLGLSKTSAFRILRTLEVTGHVVPDGHGLYKLTPGSHAIAPTQWVAKLVRVGVPHLRALSHELAETATLAAHFENRVEVVAVVESAHDIRMSNVVGHIVPPNASSLGKVITAFQAPDQQERLLRSFKIYRFTEHTITDRKLLLREYLRVREQGFAIDREECATGGVCFAVPVLGGNGHVPAAISVSMPLTRLTEPRQQTQILAAIQETAALLAHDLDLA